MDRDWGSHEANEVVTHSLTHSRVFSRLETCTFLLCALLIFEKPAPTHAENFRVEGAAESNRHFRLTFPASTSWYHLIRVADVLTNSAAWGLTGLVLGIEGTQSWCDTDALLGPARRFYRVGYRNISHPADSDEDGMDDVWELRHGLRPLDSSDAGEDPDEDGFSNLEEYQAGADPRRFDPAPQIAITWPRDGGALP